MAITKVIDLIVDSNLSQTTSEVNALNTSIDKTSKNAGKLSANLGGVDSENKNISKSAKESALSILDNGGAMGLLNDASGGLAMSIKDGVEAFGLFDKGTKISTLSQTIFTTVVGTSTGALKAFKIALATTGVGVLIIALGYFITKMNEATDATESEVKAQELLKISIDQTIRSYNDLLNEQNSYATASRLRAEIAGKSTKDLLAIDLEASEERRRILKDEETALFRQQANRKISAEENKKVNDRLLQIGRERIEELNKQEILRLNYAKGIADQERSDAKANEEKRLADIKKYNDDRIAKELEYQKQLKTELEAFNLAIVNAEFEQRQLTIDDVQRQSDEIALIEAKREKDEKDASDARIALAKAESKAKIEALDAVSSTLGMAADLAGRQTGIGKVLAIAQATISMFTSAQKAYEATVGIPFVGPTLAPINAGLAIAVGLKNIKSITSVKVPNGGGGGGAPSVGGQGGSAAPQFNVVGASGVNQLANVVGNKQQAPVQAYVVANNVTTAQSLDRNIIQSASLG